MIHLSAVSEVALNLAPEILTNVMALGGGWLLINSPAQMLWDTPLPAGWIPSWYAPPGCERMRGTLAAAGKEPVQECLLQRVRSSPQRLCEAELCEQRKQVCEGSKADSTGKTIALETWAHLSTCGI